MSRRFGFPHIVISAAAVVWGIAIVTTLSTGSALGILVPAVSVTLLLVVEALHGGRRSEDQQVAIRKATESAEMGRKLAMYDRHTGLLAYWYLVLRGEEECSRAVRYGRPLTLLLATPALGADPTEVADKLASWLATKVRSADIVGTLGDGGFVMLMPETDAMHAWTVVRRLRRDVAGAELAVSTCPLQAQTFEELYEVASNGIRDVLQLAA